MNVLAIETSSSFLSVAAQRKDGRLAEANLKGALGHTEKLISLTRQVLGKLHIKKGEIDLLVCGLGPGSFTGLRIGLSAAKGLVLGLKKKMAGVSSLDAIAEGVSMPSGKLAVVLDARREQLYAGIYQFENGKYRKVLKDSLLSFDQLIRVVNEDTIFTGNALVTYGERIKKTLGSPAVFLKESFWYPKATSVLKVIQKQKGKIKFLTLNQLKPAYLRLSEAEERRKKGSSI